MKKIFLKTLLASFIFNFNFLYGSLIDYEYFHHPTSKNIISYGVTLHLNGEESGNAFRLYLGACINKSTELLDLTKFNHYDLWGYKLAQYPNQSKGIYVYHDNNSKLGIYPTYKSGGLSTEEKYEYCLGANKNNVATMAVEKKLFWDSKVPVITDDQNVQLSNDNKDISYYVKFDDNYDTLKVSAGIYKNSTCTTPVESNLTVANQELTYVSSSITQASKDFHFKNSYTTSLSKHNDSFAYDFKFNISALVDGTYYIRASAQDNVVTNSNKNFYNFKYGDCKQFVKDTTKPTINITNSNKTRIEAKITDANLHTNNVNLKIYDSNECSNSKSGIQIASPSPLQHPGNIYDFTWDLTGNTNSVFYYQIDATDDYGNTHTSRCSSSGDLIVEAFDKTTIDNDKPLKFEDIFTNLNTSDEDKKYSSSYSVSLSSVNNMFNQLFNNAYLKYNNDGYGVYKIDIKYKNITSKTTYYCHEPFDENPDNRCEIEDSNLTNAEKITFYWDKFFLVESEITGDNGNNEIANSHKLDISYRDYELNTDYPYTLQGKKEHWIKAKSKVSTSIELDKSTVFELDRFTYTNFTNYLVKKKQTEEDETGVNKILSYHITNHMSSSYSGKLNWIMKKDRYKYRVTLGQPFSLDSFYPFNIGPKAPDNLIKRISNFKPKLSVKDGLGDSNALNSMIYTPKDDGNGDFEGQIYFTRPGVFLLDWNLYSEDEPSEVTLETLSIEVEVIWPESYIEHIAQTKPVLLDILENDNIYFKAIKLVQTFDKNDKELKSLNSQDFIKDNKYFEIDEWQGESRSDIYKAVLVFTKSDDNIKATGDIDTEDIMIRVVKSRHWSNELIEQNTTIGEEIKSEQYHDDGLTHTGYIMQTDDLKNSMYNVDSYNTETLEGSIFAVNTEKNINNREDPSKDGINDLIVAWYNVDDSLGGIAWPHKTVRYTPYWPDDSDRIVIASRLGSDGLKNENNTSRQMKFDPALYKNITIYNQPDINKSGYNPNEEHAFIENSFYYNEQLPRPKAVFALRNDLNGVGNSDYTSLPFVLITYQESNTSKYKMNTYKVQISDHNTTDAHSSYVIDKDGDGEITGDEKIGLFEYDFEYPINAGDKVVAPYPLNTIIGANTIEEISGYTNKAYSNAYWEDKDGNSWVVAGGSSFYMNFWYPMQKDFWHPNKKIKSGDILPFSSNSEYKDEFFISDGKNYLEFNNSIDIKFNTYWKKDIPEIRVGETITFEGGEEKKDNPKAKGAPSVVAWASGEVIYDEQNSKGLPKDWQKNYSVKLQPAVREIKVDLSSKDFPDDLLPSTPLTTNKGGKWFFEELHAGLKQRIYYDPTSGKLVLRGILNDKMAGDSTLTKSPGGYNYILQPNILTKDDLVTLRSLSKANTELKNAFNKLYALSQNPNLNKTELNSVTYSSDGDKVNYSIDYKISTDAIELVQNPQKETFSDSIDLYNSNYCIDYNKTSFTTCKNVIVPDLNNKKKTDFHNGIKKRFPRIDVPLKVSDMNFVDNVINKNTKLTFENNTLSLEPIITPTESGDKYTINVNYFPADLKVKLLEYAYKYSELKKPILSMFALIYDDNFNDFEPLTIQKPNGSYKIKYTEYKVSKLSKPQSVENNNSVGLSRFLRDKNNKLLVTDSLNFEKLKLKLPNGKLPSGISISQLELVKKNELPVGVSIEDPDTAIALQNEDVNFLVRLKNGEGFVPASQLGTGLALFTNSNLLKPNSNFKSSYVVIAENNDPSLDGSPVQLHFFKVVNRPYRGQIKTVFSDNVFDEKITLRHTGDFAGDLKDLVFDWWYRETDGKETPPELYLDPSCSKSVLSDASLIGGWKPFTEDGNEIVFGKTTGKDVVVDNSFYVRYRHKDCNENNISCWSGWAGSGGNLPCIDPQPIYKSQLVKGWVKRVTDKVNVFDARINNFSSDNPATYISMVEQIGLPYVGDVALNPDKNVIENVGLAALYKTVLNRAEGLTIDAAQPASTDGVTQALQNAASRISKFYTLLGNEAYSDALDPTIAFSTDERTYDNLSTSMFSFMNQLGTLAEEELTLLRGMKRDKENDIGAAPVHNRLLWNFTNGEGEAFYALNYNIVDKNNDGFIEYDDAKIMYPQGHGDAWGHYLSSLLSYYELLQNKNFNWVSRSEKYEIDGITLDVDYYDERTFAEAAAYKAKTGSEIVDLTYRDLYEEDPDAQWQGYKDSEAWRAWGVDGWAKRTHMGAYFDWAVANAILPAEDLKNTGIQKIDRTTIGELHELSTHGSMVLTKLSQINSGLNPLGVLPDAVPFDIEPNSDKTYFEQIYVRAEKSLENAKRVFDYASDIKLKNRRTANSQQEFQENVFEQDMEYRNRLIEIFGTPYDGVIGPGKTYPEGYKGADIYFYDYVDVSKISEENMPVESGNTHQYLTAYLNKLITPNFEVNKSLSFREEHSGAITKFHEYFPSDFSDGSFNGDAAGFTPDISLEGGFAINNVTYPLSNNRYAFDAPSDWGQRKYPGRLQSAIIDMVKADVDFHLAYKNYAGMIDDLRRIEREIRARADLRDAYLGTNNDLTASASVTAGAIQAFQTVASIAGAAQESLEDNTEAAITSLPMVNGVSNDISSPVRGTIKLATATVNASLKLTENAANQGSLLAEQAREIADIRIERKNIRAEADYDIKQYMFEIDQIFNTEPEERLALFKARENVRQAVEKVRSIKGEGLRLMEEREAFNKRVAFKTQGRRYQDMAFRMNRNEAAQKYKAAFDMAAKYGYLAAKAYDYETNLSPNNPSSAQHVLKNIVKARTLGGYDEGAVIGEGGLSEIMAKLKANYEVLKTQMGINNPQNELNTISLRHELFRIKDSNSSGWQQTLLSKKVENLWDLEEFRSHMRPFANESLGKQPGLVIRFKSKIESGLNFFGNQLGGNDHAFDPSQYSTRIKSIGIKFENYAGLGLAETARAYLVPVGQDYMYVPDSYELDVREWSVKDQKIATPVPFGKEDIEDSSWMPNKSLNGVDGLIRRHSQMRVYGDSDEANSSMNSDTRLYGRSVWNNEWLLIIPGANLLSDQNTGLNLLICGEESLVENKSCDEKKGIKDIKLIMSTYAYSGN